MQHHGTTQTMAIADSIVLKRRHPRSRGEPLAHTHTSPHQPQMVCHLILHHLFARHTPHHLHATDPPHITATPQRVHPTTHTVVVPLLTSTLS